MEGRLTFEIEADELEIFLLEVNEHLQAMEASILGLEHRGSDPDTLNTAFRAAHTLKAVAATVGHHSMAELTHSVETLFDAMREGSSSPTHAVADELLAALDTLKALRDEVVSRLPSGIDVAATLARLQTLAEGAKGEESERDQAFERESGFEIVPRSSHVEDGQEIGRRLTPEQAAQAQDYHQQGYSLLEVEACTQADAFAPGARLMQATMALMEAGQIIVQHPSQAELAEVPDECCLWVVLATQADRGSVEALLRDISDLAEPRVRPYAMDQQSAAPHAPAALERGELRPQMKREQVSPPQISMVQAGEKTVRISVERLDILMNLVGELVTDRTRLVQVEQSLHAKYGKGGIINTLSELTVHFGRVVDQLQEEVMESRMLPIAHLFSRFPRLMRDTARAGGKQVNLIVEGEATELDRSIIEAIGDPLMHLLRNAVDHGIESPQARIAVGKPPAGKVWLTAAHEEGHIVIIVRDDGRGIDLERVRRAAVSRGLLSEEEAAQVDDEQAAALIFQPSLSTAEQITGVSGRGVGLDVVQTNIKRLGGSVVVESEVGRGTTFRLTLPLTLTILQTMLVALGEDVYAIPLTGIVESLYLDEVSVAGVKGKPVIRWRDQALPLLYLRHFFDHPRLAAPSNGARQAVVTVTWGKLQVGLIVDRLIGKQEIVVKSLSPLIGNAPGLSGCTILGDGRVALIVDIPGLISAEMQAQRQG